MAATVLLTLLLLQARPAEAGEAAQLERIRRALLETSRLTVSQETRTEGLVFRATVRGRKPDKTLWDDWSIVPPYVRPFAPTYHHEFQSQVTHEFFRSAVLYPSGVPVVRLAGFLTKHIKAANRKRQEQNAREEVRQAMEALRACQADPARPGC